MNRTELTFAQRTHEHRHRDSFTRRTQEHIDDNDAAIINMDFCDVLDMVGFCVVIL